MPAYRTRDSPSRSLEVTVEASRKTPALNIISPTPRAFTFPVTAYTPSPSPSNSPFESDLRPFTLTPPHKTHTPSSSVSSISSFLSPESAQSSPTARATTHRRRRSTASDINERRPKKGDEDYIKRPENAFILFRRKCCEDRNLALGAGEAGEGAEGPVQPTKKQRQADLSKAISQQWKGLSNEERQYWEDLAKEKKKEHELLYPHYVYRPQRVKKGKGAAAKGKGKAAEGEGEADGEAISFIMPVPAVPQRHGRRAASAPTPPPAYQQTIQVPMLYMPSTPTSPSTVPMISRRTSSPAPQFSMQDSHLSYDYVRTDGLLQPSFGQPPQSWNPDLANPDAFQAMFEMPQGTYVNKGGAPMGMPDAHAMYAHHGAPADFAADSSGPPSPQHGPYTPTLETLQIPADAWQAQPALQMGPSPMESAEPRTLEYQPYAWQPDDVWTHGGEPLFNEDFDLSLIPPIALDVPKFDAEGPPPAYGGGAHDHDYGRDAFLQVFTLDDLTMNVDGY